MIKIWTKELIIDLLKNNDTMVIKTLLRLHEIQIDNNFLNGVARYYFRNFRLTPRQIEACRDIFLKYPNGITELANNPQYKRIGQIKAADYEVQRNQFPEFLDMAVNALFGSFRNEEESDEFFGNNPYLLL